MKILALFGLRALIAISILPCPSKAMSEPASALEPDALTAAGVTRAQAQFAERLLVELAREHSGENIVVSPASLAGMLTAADLVADADTRNEIRKALQIGQGESIDAEMNALGAVTTHVLASDGLTLVTRLMFDRLATPSDAGRARLEQAGADVAVEGLHGPGVLADIDAWAARATDGKVTHVLDEIAPDCGLIALNALLFKTRWAAPFKETDTWPADFFEVSGERARVAFMHSHDPESLLLREDADFIGVEIPFIGHRFSLTIVTTKTNPSTLSGFGDHLNWLAGEDFKVHDRVFLELPRFRVATQSDLVPSLASLGFHVEDNTKKNQFTESSRSDLKRAEIRQIVDLNINEMGAEIAAITVGTFEIQGGYVEHEARDVVIDRPFIYALRDLKMGTVIAAGYTGLLPGEPVPAGAPVASARSIHVMSEAEKKIWTQAVAKEANRRARHPVGSGDHLRMERNF